jgi:hypothetical protein
MFEKETRPKSEPLDQIETQTTNESRQAKETGVESEPSLKTET